MPLGRCRSITAIETLFTFWPPGPEDRAKVSSRSASEIPSCFIRLLISRSAIATELFPKLRPAFTQMPTNQNVGMIGSLLVHNAILVGDATHQLARSEIPIPKRLRKSDQDQDLWRWLAVTARPE